MPRVTPKRPTEMDAIAAAQMREAQKRADRRGRSPYGPDSPHSYFGDLRVAAQARARREAALDSPYFRGRDPGGELPVSHRNDTLQSVNARLQDAAAEAEIRMLRLGIERRDLDTQTLFGGAEFVASSMPDFLAAEFASGAATQANLTVALRKIPLPKTGISYSVPTIEDGPSVEGKIDNQSVSETDPVTNE